MHWLIEWFIFALGFWIAASTLLNLSSSPHWYIRAWDFPRVAACIVICALAATHLIFFHDASIFDWIFLASLGVAFALHAYRIAPYVPLAPRRVQHAQNPTPDSRLSLVATNVEMDNTHFERWLEVMRQADPDIIFALEVDQRWLEQIRKLKDQYPTIIEQPQDNCYGMVMLSRLDVIDPEIQFLVQDDIPSLHARVKLRNGETIRFIGLHPRPPEPIRDQDSKPRDAELVIVGRSIGEEEEDTPTIVTGDLNDVAWSATTQLFLRLSGLLDPRKGRGLYNSFHARIPFFRFPLDHFFHSNDFRLVRLRRLPQVGSDHFPMFIELSYEPEAEAEQEEPQADGKDHKEAQEKVDREAAAPSKRMIFLDPHPI